jgi:hypothetical protein
MKVLLGFLLGVFILAGALEARGGRLPFRWLFAITTLVAMSFYSLRVLS